MRYLLSKLIPVPMRSTYRVGTATGPVEHATWWQWRGHIYRHRVSPVGMV